MDNSKRERTMVIATIILAIVLVISAIYDRNSALLKRTLAYELPEGARIVKVEKHGFAFYRVGYEAKIEVNPENPEEVLKCFVEGYDFSGGMMTGNEYQRMSELIFGEDGQFNYVNLRPDPAVGSGVWVCEVITEDEHTILQMLDIEDGDHSYLYIYYIR